MEGPGTGNMADLFNPQQFAVFHDISPVEPAGVVYKKKHLAVWTERVQCFQGLSGQGADTENNDAAGQGKGPFWKAPGRFQKKSMQAGTAGMPFQIRYIRLNQAP